MPLTSANYVYLSVGYIMYAFYGRVGESLAKKVNQLKEVCGFPVDN